MFTRAIVIAAAVALVAAHSDSVTAAKRQESTCKDFSCYSEEYVPPTAPVSSCNTGDLMCCNQVQPAKTFDFSQYEGSEIFEYIPDQLRDSNAPVGTDCSPITQDTSGGVQCNAQAVCCDGGHFSGVFSVNCNAFNAGSQSTAIF
ncbi:fungal hydrophobin [Peniophora sp. CONT]|nr:fungal hydrophobin [Peniophora sp. CONT]